MRRLPLGAWLGLGFALAVAAPALSAGTTWWAVGAHQEAGIDDRLARAAELVAATAGQVDDPAAQHRLVRRLAALGVEAELQLTEAGIIVSPDPGVGVLAPEVAKPVATQSASFVTDGLAAVLEGPDPKRALTSDYETQNIAAGAIAGSLFAERPSGAVRVAATLAAGFLALALALIAGVVLLRRWVVTPLSRLAADAERIAGGELAVEPVSSRTREVAEVGAALRGMADGLSGALAEQHAADEQRRFLVSAIAHDLRTPLFTLRGSLEAIEHGIGNGDQLRRAQDKATLLDRLVGDLFTFSRLEYAGPELTVEVLDAVVLAREAADMVDSRIDVVARHSRAMLDGDHAALVRVLVNLLDNAVRHARSRVELHVSADRYEVRFEVLDDGPGIAASDLPHLFEPLFRADRTRNSATGGAGLGLAIVERLTAAHNGRVEAGNRPAGGARFVACYPLSRRQPSAIPVRSTHIPRSK